MAKASKAGGWIAGFAQVEITPRKGAPMAGYGRERYSQGTIAPLIAQALVLRAASGSGSGSGAGSGVKQSKQTVVFIAADIIGFSVITLELLRARAGKKYGVDPAAVVLVPSHTHWGPGSMYRFNFYAGKPNPFFMRDMEAKLLKLMDDAFADLAPASVGYTSVEARIGHNRRVPTPDGGATWGVNEKGHYDTHTPILRVRREVSAERGSDIVLVTHACHTTSSGGVDKWSPDYAGGLREGIAKKLGKGARCIFGMGCGADAKVSHIDKASGKVVFSASPADSRAGGRALADAVLSQLKKGDAKPLAASVRARRATGRFTLAKRPSDAQRMQLASDPATSMHDWSWARIAVSFPDPRTKYEYEAALLVLGDELSIFALPDEVCSPLGPRTRAQARTPQAMVIGYANSVQCYMPNSQIVREGGYEGDTSHRSYLMPAPFTTKIDREFTALIERLVK